MTETEREAHPLEPVEDRCCNCGQPLAGPYCSQCGQRATDLQRPIRELAAEGLEAVLALDSRLLRTLGPLVVRPGFLTLEFLAGRRVRYVHPLKLYLAISLLFFVALAFSGYRLVRSSGERAKLVTVTVDESPEEQPVESDPPAASSSGLPRGLGWLAKVGELHEEDPDRLDRVFVDRLAQSIFVLVPVFALLLKPLYRRRRILYIEHLVFSLHLHAFAFLVILAGLGVNALASRPDGPGGSLAQLAIVVYAFLALRRIHGDSRVRTAVKLVAVLFAYLLALIVTMFATLYVTTLTM